MKVNLYGGHFSYIFDFDKYTRTVICKKCNKLFSLLSKLKRHEPKCQVNVRQKYRQGGYGNPETVFDELLRYGIAVNPDDRFYPYRSMFDFETFCKPLPENGVKLHFTKELVPASVSVATNVPGISSDGWNFLEPRCFVSSGNVSDLVADMFAYLCEISDRCFYLLNEKLADIFSDMDRCIERLSQGKLKVPYTAKELNRVKIKLTRWMKQHPVLGFNSARFDVPLILKFLVPYLIQNDIKIENCIKQANGFMSLSTEKLVFLDILKFLGPGINYASFLKAFNVKEKKLVFCYDAFSSLEMLSLTTLPPHSAFFSELTQTNVSIEEYQAAQKRWKEKNMQTFRDFLVDYNNADTGPGLVAIERMWEHWRNLGLDMFKEAVSLPGLSSLYLFKTLSCETIFVHIKESDAWLLNSMKANLIGGPSLIYSRYAEVNKTFIPGTENYVKCIRTYDANSLYLACLMGNMPSGIYAVYKPIRTDLDMLLDAMAEGEAITAEQLELNMRTEFVREISYKYAHREISWMSYLAHRLNVPINHKFNGKQLIVRYGDTKYYPDGYLPTLGVLLGYNSCFR